MHSLRISDWTPDQCKGERRGVLGPQNSQAFEGSGFLAWTLMELVVTYCSLVISRTP